MAETNVYALNYNGKRMGVYNAKTRVYRVPHPISGKLSGPVDPPWKTTSTTSETTSAARQQASKPASVTASTEGEKKQSKQPPWVPFAIGGGVTGAVLLLGFVFRR